MTSRIFNNATRSKRRHRQRGFTLVEAMIALTVTGILIAVGLPHLNGYAASRAVKAKVSALSSAMRLARTEAVKRGMRVTICPSVNPNAAVPNCTVTNQWQTGWIIFSDRGVPNVVDAGLDQVIRIQNAFADTGLITNAGAIAAVNFFPNGVAIGGQRQFTFLAQNPSMPGADHFARRMCQSTVGSTRVIKYTEVCS